MRSLAAALLVVSCCANSALAQLPSPKNPYNLQLWGSVQKAGSDARAQDFQKNVLPTFQAFIQQNLQEYSRFNAAPKFVLDPEKLYLPLATSRPARVYFVSEGAAYRNQMGLAISTAGHGQTSGSALVDPLKAGKLVFIDASFKNPSDGLTPGGPLNAGDFVEIGNVSAGKQLDFFLISNGASGGTAVLRNFPELNNDGLQHVIGGYYADTFPGYVLICFEDIDGGGDLDYNDCCFILDVGYDLTVDQSTLPH
jgi:hypothetical protein